MLSYVNTFRGEIFSGEHYVTTNAQIVKKEYICFIHKSLERKRENKSNCGKIIIDYSRIHAPVFTIIISRFEILQIKIVSTNEAMTLFPINT